MGRDLTSAVDRLRTREQLVLPVGDLVGVHVMLMGQLGQRLVASNGGQCQLGLECRRVRAAGSLLMLAPVLTGDILALKFAGPALYSSWLNRVELWFAKIERDVIARGVFTSVLDLKRKLMHYIRQYNKQPKPVMWKYFDPSRRIASTSNVTVH